MCGRALWSLAHTQACMHNTCLPNLCPIFFSHVSRPWLTAPAQIGCLVCPTNLSAVSYCGWTSSSLSACAHACLQEVRSISERAGELELASLDTRAGGSGAHDDDDIQMDDPVGTRAMPPPTAPVAARCAARYSCFCPPPPPFCLAGVTLSLHLMPATCCLTVRGRGRGAGRGRAGAAAPKAVGRQTSITEVLSQSSSRAAAAATR